MTKEQVFQALDKAIENIGEHFCAEECEWILEEQLRNAKLPFEWSIDSGISKAVILIKGAPFVIKLPFTHIYDEEGYSDAHYEWEQSRDSAYDEALSAKNAKANRDDLLLTLEESQAINSKFAALEPDGSEDRFYLDIDGATSCDLDNIQENEDWDYCQLECSIYEAAVERGLGAYFAEEGRLGDLQCAHPVYYQQRCIPLSEMEINYNDDYKDMSNAVHHTCSLLKIDCFNAKWIYDFITLYGEDELKRLNAFLEDMDIADLRPCNIGYLDDAPILFDYSGFRSLVW